jgi:carbon-monoxide dehydrogenase medium subunit
MKPPPFEYAVAGSTEEAVALLAEHGDDAKVLAGGQSLLPLLSLRLAHPAYLIDVNAVPDLEDTTNDDGLELGAVVRQRAAERSDVVKAANPLVAAAITFIGHTAIRNRGTIGGSVAHADPAAELPAVLLALDGEVHAQSSRGPRTIPAATFFNGFLTTALEPDELLTTVQFPAWTAGTGWSLQEVSRRSGDFAIAGVVTTLRLDDGKIAEGRMAFSGVGATPMRAESAELMLIGEAPSSELWQAAAETAAAELDPPSDLHGTTAYRRHLAAVLARRSLAEAHDRAEDHR